MAALTLVAASAAAPAAFADDKTTPPPSVPAMKAPAAEKTAAAGKAAARPAGPKAPESAKAGDGRQVKLEVLVAGLGAQGCDVEVKPAHPACTFRPAPPMHMDRSGQILPIVLEDVETRSADRDCTFAITLKTPGQADRTFHRGVRLETAPRGVQSLRCYFSSTSKLAKAAEPEPTRKR